MVARIRSKKSLWITLLVVAVVVVGIVLNSIIPHSGGESATDGRDYKGIPPELQGTWCSVTDKSKCINFADLLAWWPEATIDYDDGGDKAPSSLIICLKGEACITADTLVFDYFPVGVAWDCKEDAKSYALDSCDPDYTNLHDTSKPRLRLAPSHQHNAEYVDAVPLYLNPSATGAFSDVPDLY